jgi:hypothetical protein
MITTSSAYPKRSVKKNTGYKIVFGNCVSWTGEHTTRLTIYPSKEYHSTNGGFSNAINITLDEDDWTDLQNIDKKLNFTKDDEYPFYRENNRSISILEYLFGYKPSDNIYVFKNNDNMDLRRENITCYPPIYSQLVEKYNIIDYIPGHVKTIGQHAYKMKNPIWKIKENEKEYFLMYCEKDTLCKLCPVSYQKILDFEIENNNGEKMTFFKNGTNYILSHFGTSGIHIHQIITGCYGNGKGTKNISVDHIDQDPLNNTYDNLRVVSQEVQQQNTKGIKEGTKRARKKTAKPLPDGITEDMVRKYVYYSNEKYGKNNKLRTYFCVCHPKLETTSSKSEKVSILEKLAQANKIVDDLENDIYPIVEEKVLPTFVSNRDYRGKPHLTFDRKAPDGTRQNLRMVLPEEYELEEQLTILREKIKRKYNYEIL